jgi:flagellar protein FlgJ
MSPISTPSPLDLQGLAELKYRAAREDPAALAEAAAQFEALFIGLMLKTARDASLSEGILDGEDTLQYLELMDQHLAVELARGGGFGLGKMLIDQLGGEPAQPAESVKLSPPARPDAAVAAFPRGLPATLVRRASAEHAQPFTAKDESASGSFAARFVADATAAARKLGIDPKIVLAQAALETGWGEAAPRHPDGRPTHNMFGIKAGSSWDGASVAHWTIESSAGAAQRTREQFRAYPSSTASFQDYVDLIAGSPRYAAAAASGGDAAAYVRAVTAAGYATDPSYADKWLAIYHGDRLNKELQDLKLPLGEPIQ